MLYFFGSIFLMIMFLCGFWIYTIKFTNLPSFIAVVLFGLIIGSFFVSFNTLLGTPKPIFGGVDVIVVNLISHDIPDDPEHKEVFITGFLDKSETPNLLQMRIPTKIVQKMQEMEKEYHLGKAPPVRLQKKDFLSIDKKDTLNDRYKLDYSQVPHIPSKQ